MDELVGIIRQKLQVVAEAQPGSGNHVSEVTRTFVQKAGAGALGE